MKYYFLICWYLQHFKRSRGLFTITLGFSKTEQFCFKKDYKYFIQFSQHDFLYFNEFKKKSSFHSGFKLLEYFEICNVTHIQLPHDAIALRLNLNRTLCVFSFCNIFRTKCIFIYLSSLIKYTWLMQ